MSTIKAYLVEPAAGTIRPVAIRQDHCFAEIRSLIGCDLIDMVRIDDAHHLVLDDNGLTDGLHCFTQVRGYPSPLAGNLLVVGTNEDGNTTDVRVSIEEIATSLTIFGLSSIPSSRRSMAQGCSERAYPGCSCVSRT